MTGENPTLVGSDVVVGAYTVQNAGTAFGTRPHTSRY